MSGYIGNTPIPQATQTRDSFTATASQTSFATGGYTPNFLDVYLNGLKLNSSQFTATNGTDVVLTSAASSGDIVEVIAYTAFEVADASFDDLALGGDLTVGGTVDGRDIAADGTKLDGIESGATADQTNAEIRAAVEAATDSNVFTDADHTKLNAIEASATADQTAAEIRTLVESATDSNVFTDADHTKLNGIEASATADQTKSDIDALNINADTLDGQHGSYYTGYADTAVANIVDSAPGTLDTLNELAAALGDDPNFATTTATNIATKLPLAGGTMTGDINFGDNDKVILGAGSDANIRHDGGNTKFSHTGSGGLYLGSDTLALQSGAHNETYLSASVNGAVSLRYDNNIKLATTSTGIDVTGKVTSTGLIGNNTNFDIIQNTSDGSDNKRTRIGGGGDVVSSRGAMIEMSGNEHGNGGMLLLKSGHGGAYSQIRSYTSNTERMRIDSSGNVLVGTTTAGVASSSSVQGIQIAPTTLSVARSGGQVAFFNRQTNDGAIVDFRKDGSTVGSIGTISSLMTIGTGTTGLIFDSGQIYPWNTTTNAAIDASKDLGASGARFKDLYLSGNAYANTYRHDGDSDTYLNFPAANQLSLVGGGATIVKAYKIAGAYGVLEMHGSGSATYPNFTFNGDSNTGMYRANTDTLAFTTGGTERMRINASGDILGKTADVRIGSDVGAVEYGTSTGNSVRFYSNDTERVRIDASGNVGIGTSNPTHKLHVDGTLRTNGTVTHNSANLNLTADNARILIEEADGTDITWLGDHTGNGHGALFLYNHGGAPTVKLTADSHANYINNGNNFGIGTSSPQEMIHAMSGSTSAAIRASGEGNYNRKVEIGYHASDGPYIKGGSSGITSLKFYVDNTSLALTLANNRNATFAQSVTATTFHGDGSNLTGVGGSTAFGAVGTYVIGYGSNNVGYSTGDTIAGSAIGYDDGGSFNGGGLSKFLYSGGSSSSGSVAFGYYGYWSSLGLSGTWRAMTEGGAAAVGRIQAHLWVRVS